VVKGVMPVSGLLGLRPLVDSFANDWLFLGPDRAAALSPALVPAVTGPRLVLAVAEHDPMGFRTQSADFHAAWRAHSPSNLIVVPDRNHFDVFLDSPTPPRPSPEPSWTWSARPPPAVVLPRSRSAQAEVSPCSLHARRAQAGAPATKWFMLTIVSAGFIAMTVNWFDISTGFPVIDEEFGLAILDVAFLISIFVAACGLLHIPRSFPSPSTRTWSTGGSWPSGK
jgi:hypothetical protein